MTEIKSGMRVKVGPVGEESVGIVLVVDKDSNRACVALNGRNPPMIVWLSTEGLTPLEGSCGPS